MRTSLLLTAALGLLAGCNQAPSSNEATAPSSNAAGGTDYVAALKAMPEEQRRATFLRAIRDAGQACQQVVEEKEDTAAAGGWGVRCEDGRGWLIVIAPDGNAKVTGPVAPK